MNDRPRLRSELTFHGQEDRGGAVHVYDPRADRFFRFEGIEARVARALDGTATAAEISAALARDGRYCPESLVDALIEICARHGLLAGSQPGTKPEPVGLARLFYTRFAMCDPDAHLGPAAAVWRALCNRWTALPFALLLLSALWLVAHDLPRAMVTGVDCLSPAGLPWLLLTIAGIKVLHELGHAAAAKRHGCAVHESGIALLCLLPCLYVETSAAWSLPRRLQRLEIAAAGILVEVAIGACAAHVWYHTAPGTINAIAFHLMAVSWTMSLFVNGNPLMKFDGYFVLSDALDQPNLAARATARIRYLFWHRWMQLPGLSNPATSTREGRGLAIFGVAMLAWRLLFGLIIAQAVYARFTPILGAVLFVLAMWLFLVRPIVHVTRQFLAVRTRVRPRVLPTILIGGAALGLLVGLVVPVAGHRVFTGIVEPGLTQLVVAPIDGRIDACEAREGLPVRADTVLCIMDATALDHEVDLAELDLSIAERRLRWMESNPETRREIGMAVPEVANARARLARLHGDRANVKVLASTNSIVLEWDSTLDRGALVQRGQPLGRIAVDGHRRVRALVGEREIGQFDLGQPVEVWIASAPRPVRGAVLRIDRYSRRDLQGSPFAAHRGGSIATRVSDDHSEPFEPLYEIVVATEASDLPLGTTGHVRIPGSRTPILAQMYEAVLRRVYREVLF